MALSPIEAGGLENPPRCASLRTYGVVVIAGVSIKRLWQSSPREDRQGRVLWRGAADEHNTSVSDLCPPQVLRRNKSPYETDAKQNE